MQLSLGAAIVLAATSLVSAEPKFSGVNAFPHVAVTVGALIMLSPAHVMHDPDLRF